MTRKADIISSFRIIFSCYCTLSNVNSRRLSISSKTIKSEVTFPIGIIRMVSCPMSGSSALA